MSGYSFKSKSFSIVFNAALAGDKQAINALAEDMLSGISVFFSPAGESGKQMSIHEVLQESNEEQLIDAVILEWSKLSPSNHSIRSIMYGAYQYDKVQSIEFLLNIKDEASWRDVIYARKVFLSHLNGGFNTGNELSDVESLKRLNKIFENDVEFYKMHADSMELEDREELMQHINDFIGFAVARVWHYSDNSPLMKKWVEDIGSKMVKTSSGWTNVLGDKLNLIDDDSLKSISSVLSFVKLLHINEQYLFWSKANIEINKCADRLISRTTESIGSIYAKINFQSMANILDMIEKEAMLCVNLDRKVAAESIVCGIWRASYIASRDSSVNQPVDEKHNDDLNLALSCLDLCKKYIKGYISGEIEAMAKRVNDEDRVLFEKTMLKLSFEGELLNKKTKASATL